MLTIEDISRLLDVKLEPIQRALNERQEALNERQETLNEQQKTLNHHHHTGAMLGYLVGARVRDEAKRMFGHSFAKRFSVRSIHDVVYLISKARFKGLVESSNPEKGVEATRKLVERAASVRDAVARAFFSAAKNELSGINYDSLSRAEDAAEEKDFGKCLGILIGALKQTDGVPQDIVRFMVRLAKAFPSEQKKASPKQISDALLSCDGPGVMLLELSSRFNDETSQWTMATGESFFDSVCESIEYDLRGTITLVDTHATIACGEIKTSYTGLKIAKKQLLIRTQFLKHAVNVIFGEFENVVLLGHIFILMHSIDEDRTQFPEDQMVENGVSYYMYRV